MEQAFDQCQQFEERRLRFIREVLLDMKHHLNLTEDQRSEERLTGWEPTDELTRCTLTPHPFSSQLNDGVQRARTHGHIRQPTGRSEVVLQHPRPGHAHELAPLWGREIPKGSILVTWISSGLCKWAPQTIINIFWHRSITRTLLITSQRKKGQRRAVMESRWLMLWREWITIQQETSKGEAPHAYSYWGGICRVSLRWW